MIVTLIEIECLLDISFDAISFLIYESEVVPFQKKTKKKKLNKKIIK